MTSQIRGPRAIAVLLLALFCGTGCQFLGGESPPINRYVLRVEREQKVSRSAGPVLELRRFGSAPTCTLTEFIYRTDVSRVQTDYYHQFLLPPGEIFTDNVRRWLSHSGLFASVVTPGTSVAPDLLLEGTLTELHGDYRRKEQPTAVMEVQFILLRPRRMAPEILLDRSYRREVALESPGPAQLTEGWNTALEQILKAMEADLGRAISHFSMEATGTTFADAN